MNKPARKWFQVHLSTAVVMMFVAGALMWANLTTIPSETFGRFFTIQSQEEKAGLIIRHHGSLRWESYAWLGNSHSLYGWPCTAFVARYIHSIEGKETKRKFDIGDWHTDGLIIDIFVALAILLIALIACEWLIRIKARRS